MLLALSEENRYDGSFCEEKYREENLRLFEDLKKNTLIYDWWYVGESEKSIRFFSEKGFDVVSTASVHGCMTSIPSFDQQKNIQKLFKDAVKHKVKGGLVSDWIYGFGYHAEQTYFNVAAAAAMLWSGTDENCFISGVSREKFEKDYLFIRYRTEDDSLLRYFHAAGDLKGKLLGLFAPNRKGVALRKAVFYTDNPLWCYVKYIADLDGKLDEYAAAVENIDRLYASAEKSCYDDGWFRALKISVVVHDYVLRTMRTMDEFYARYDAAAKAQYTDEKAFAENLDECAKILFSLRSIYAQPIRFAKWVHEKLGLEESSIYRLRATRRNLQKLVRFIERLKENYRPLPSVSRLSESLFDTDRDTWWKMRDYEWIREEGEFKKYDVDLCQFYESLDWDV